MIHSERKNQNITVKRCFLIVGVESFPILIDAAYRLSALPENPRIHAETIFH